MEGTTVLEQPVKPVTLRKNFTITRVAVCCNTVTRKAMCAYDRAKEALAQLASDSRERPKAERRLQRAYEQMESAKQADSMYNRWLRCERENRDAYEYMQSQQNQQ
ncbi:MAG: hypothetical protein LBU65_08810 [Planctomycetaceae bacterium]|jgi:DNA-binding SARP family transcriptional activator|nr:hypothetical protein [Planctomycetaceae bacterium]